MSAACSTVKMTDKNGDLNFLGQEVTQWRDIPKEPIAYAPKKETIMLVGGLTILQDKLIETALHSIGENFVALPNPTLSLFKKVRLLEIEVNVTLLTLP